MFLAGLGVEFVGVIIYEGEKRILTGKEKVVALPFVSIGCLICQFGGNIPFLRCGCVLVYDAEFAPQETNAVLDRNDVAGDGIVATYKIRSLAASNLQSGVTYIVLPCLAILCGEWNGIGVGLPALVSFLIEETGGTEPFVVNQIVLLVADPGGSENFALVTGPSLLFFLCFFDARLDKATVVAGNRCYRDLLVFAISWAEGFVVVGGPDDVCVFLAVFRTAVVYQYRFQQDGVLLENIILSNIDFVAH